MQPRRQLSLAKIVDAAIAQADAEGVDGISMAKLAKPLGVTPMALYRHVASKDELLGHVLETALGPPPPAPETGWRAALGAWAWGMRDAMFGHPWVAELPLSRIPMGPHRLAWMEQGFAAMADTALTEPEKAATVLTLNALVLNDVRFRQELARGDEEGDTFGAMITSMLGDGFPALRRAVEAGVFEPDETPDGDFAFAVATLLDGVAKLAEPAA